MLIARRVAPQEPRISADKPLYYPYYPAQGLVGDTSVTLDFSTGTWCSVGEVAETGGWYPVTPKGNRCYTPDALAADGVR